MSRPTAKLALLSPFQKALLRVLVLLGVLVLANSLYLFGFTLWQDVTDARARLLHFYQWNLVAHFGLGILVVALAVVFSLLHLKKALRRKRWHTVVTGVLSVLACIVLLHSGVVLLRDGNSDQNAWVFHAHRIAGAVGVLAYVVHRVRSYDPPPRSQRWRIAGWIGGAAAVLAVTHAGLLSQTPPPPVVYHEAFARLDVSEDPFVPFEPIGDVPTDAPFFPSPTTLSGGQLLDPSAIMPGPPADAAAVRAEVEANGFAHEQLLGAGDCVACHQDTVAQWAASAHRFSSFNNPFYAASVLALREEAGAEASRFCGACHDPAVMLAGDFMSDIDVGSVAAQAGLTCNACHLVNRIHDVTGNGNYELADNGQDPYLFAEATDGWKLELRKYLIKARPRDHKDFFLRDFYREPEYCASCHKVSIDSEINGYRWLRGQNEYDAWHASGVSRNASRTFYLPDEARGCQDCHMPYEDAPLGDLAAKDGRVRSHRFLAVNTALAHIRGDVDTVQRIEEFLKASKLRVDVFAMEHPRDGFVMDLERNQPELRPGDEIIAYVSVRNLGVGHTFPGGTNDSNEGWLRFRATGPNGEELVASGELLEDGTLDPESHKYRAVMLKRDAEPARERDAHNFIVAGHVRVIPPGNVDVARYRVTLPDDFPAGGRLELDAALMWRKFNRHYTEFSMEYMGLEVPNLPITTIAEDALVLGDGEPRESSADDWLRYNDLGIGLLRQGDARRALAAFRAVAEVAPERVDGYRNQARVHLAEGDPQPALELLERCEELAPGDPLTKPWWADYHFALGDVDSAEKALLAVLDAFPEDRSAWRDLSDVRYDARDYQGSLAAALQALRIDPEDAQAHYRRMLVYAALGDDFREAEAKKAFDRYRIDDNAPQLIRQWRLSDPIANRDVDPLHVK